MKKVMRNVLTIQQGATWDFSISLYDDDIYKAKYHEMIIKYADLYSEKMASALILLLSSNINQDTLKQVTEDLLDGVMTASMLNDFELVFKEVQHPLLIDKKVKIYFQIYKAVGSTRTMPFIYEAPIYDGVAKFNIPAWETQKMVHKTNHSLEELTGYYVIELNDTTSNEVLRILEGDVIISKGAKDVCENPTTEE